MNVEWLNDERTEARITKGWWRWRRRAYVTRMRDWCSPPEGGFTQCWWKFTVSGQLVSGWTSTRVEWKRDWDRDWSRQDWQRVGTLPAAKLVGSTPSDKLP
jgi:hypothetical protein